MELLCFGHAGTKVLVFPTSQGRFFEYEDNGMVATLADRIDSGQLQLYCVDSVDGESWYNKHAHPYWRVQRHMQYERYIVDDVLGLDVEEEPDTTAYRHRLQLRRLSRGELWFPPPRCGDGNRDHGWGLRHEGFRRWLV